MKNLNTRIYMLFSAFSLACFVVPAPVSAALMVTYTTVVLSGQAAPGTPDGVTYNDFFFPGLSDAGHVTFRSVLAGPGVTPGE